MSYSAGLSDMLQLLLSPSFSSSISHLLIISVIVSISYSKPCQEISISDELGRGCLTTTVCSVCFFSTTLFFTGPSSAYLKDDLFSKTTVTVRDSDVWIDCLFENYITINWFYRETNTVREINNSSR